MIHTLRIENPTTLADPQLVRLVTDSAPTLANAGLTPAMVLNALVETIRSPQMGVWVAIEDGRDNGWRAEAIGYIVVVLPTSPLWPYPHVYMLYTHPGRHEAAIALQRVGLAWVKAAGYDTVWAWNLSGAPDPVFARAFKEHFTMRTRGSVVEFTIKPAGAGEGDTTWSGSTSASKNSPAPPPTSRRRSSSKSGSRSRRRSARS